MKTFNNIQTYFSIFQQHHLINNAHLQDATTITSLMECFVIVYICKINIPNILLVLIDSTKQYSTNIN